MFNFIIYLCVFLSTSAISYGTQSNIVTHANISEHSAQNHFTKPISFTQNGLVSFTKQVYNHPEYAHFLAHNFHHITQFLHNAKTQNCMYAQSVLRMFGNKLKQTSYINPYAYADLLDEISPLLKIAITHDTQYNLKEHISKTMYDQMLYKFDYLKQDPHAYFQELSENIVTLVHKNPITNTQTLQLQKIFLSFLEITLNKLVWHPSEYQAAWTNVLRIADQLNKINEDVLHNIDDLNALFITLLERFYLFLDLSYAEIPVDFYVTLHKEVDQQSSLLFTLTDINFVETKLQRFEHILIQAEAKTRAYHEGIYAQHYIPPRRQQH